MADREMSGYKIYLLGYIRQRSPFQAVTGNLEFLKIQQVKGLLYRFENLFYLSCLK